MGYYGGKGLPFFNTTFKGMELTEENKAQSQSIAKNVSDVLNSFRSYCQLLTSASFLEDINNYSFFCTLSFLINACINIPYGRVSIFISRWGCMEST
jgi:hypothetical protein